MTTARRGGGDDKLSRGGDDDERSRAASEVGGGMWSQARSIDGGATEEAGEAAAVAIPSAMGAAVMAATMPSAVRAMEAAAMAEAVRAAEAAVKMPPAARGARPEIDVEWCATGAIAVSTPKSDSCAVLARPRCDGECRPPKARQLTAASAAGLDEQQRLGLDEQQR